VDDLVESVQCLANIELNSLKAEVCVKIISAMITTKNKVISINKPAKLQGAQEISCLVSYSTKFYFLYVTVVFQFLVPES
jgi:hypothetical protein